MGMLTKGMAALGMAPPQNGKLAAAAAAAFAATAHLMPQAAGGAVADAGRQPMPMNVLLQLMHNISKQCCTQEDSDDIMHAMKDYVSEVMSGAVPLDSRIVLGHLATGLNGTAASAPAPAPAQSEAAVAPTHAFLPPQYAAAAAAAPHTPGSDPTAAAAAAAALLQPPYTSAQYAFATASTPPHHPPDLQQQHAYAALQGREYAAAAPQHAAAGPQHPFFSASPIPVDAAHPAFLKATVAPFLQHPYVVLGKLHAGVWDRDAADAAEFMGSFAEFDAESDAAAAAAQARPRGDGAMGANGLDTPAAVASGASDSSAGATGRATPPVATGHPPLSGSREVSSSWRAVLDTLLSAGPQVMGPSGAFVVPGSAGGNSVGGSLEQDLSEDGAASGTADGAAATPAMSKNAKRRKKKRSAAAT